MSNNLDLSIPLVPGNTYYIFNQGNEGRNIFFEEKHFKYFLKKYAEYLNGFVETKAYALLDNQFHLVVQLKEVSQILIKAKMVGFEKLDSLFYRRYVLPWFLNPAYDLSVIPIWKDIDIQTNLSSLSSFTVSQLEELLLPMHKNDQVALLKNSTHPENLEDLSPLMQLASYIVSERFRRFFLSYSKAINLDQGRSGSLFQKPFRRQFLDSTDEVERRKDFIYNTSTLNNKKVVF